MLRFGKQLLFESEIVVAIGDIHGDLSSLTRITRHLCLEEYCPLCQFIFLNIKYGIPPVTQSTRSWKNRTMRRKIFRMIAYDQFDQDIFPTNLRGSLSKSLLI